MDERIKNTVWQFLQTVTHEDLKEFIYDYAYHHGQFRVDFVNNFADPENWELPAERIRDRMGMMFLTYHRGTEGGLLYPLMFHEDLTADLDDVGQLIRALIGRGDLENAQDCLLEYVEWICENLPMVYDAEKVILGLAHRGVDDLELVIEKAPEEMKYQIYRSLYVIFRQLQIFGTAPISARLMEISMQLAITFQKEEEFMENTKDVFAFCCSERLAAVVEDLAVMRSQMSEHIKRKRQPRQTTGK